MWARHSHASDKDKNLKVNVASANDIPPGKMIGIEAEGEDILVANVAGSYYAVGNICTHMGCLVSEGTLNGERAQCPCHDAIFDVRTGAIIKGLVTEGLQTFNVTVENGRVMVDV